MAPEEAVLPEQSPNSETFPLRLRACEDALLRERRTKAEDVSADDERDVVGLALSGGGIRSATISLGLLEAFAEVGLLKRFDYLSTVSGGGYIGGFLGTLFLPDREPRRSTTGRGEGTPGDVDTATLKKPADIVTATLKNPQSKEVAWLRENGRYLAPAGASDEWTAAAVVARSLFAIYIVLGLSVLALFLAAHSVRAGAALLFQKVLPANVPLPVLVQGDFYGSPWLWVWLGASFLWALPAALAFWALPNERREDGRGRSGVDPAYTLLGFTLATLWAAELLWTSVIRSQWSDWISEAVAVSICALAGLIAFGLYLLATASVSSHRRRSEPEKSPPLRTPPSEAEHRRREVAKASVVALRARNLTTRWLQSALITCTGLLTFALVDSFAESLYVVIQGGIQRIVTFGFSVTAALVTAGTLLQRGLGLLGTSKSTAPIRLSYRTLALVIAIVLVFVILTSVDTVAHGFARGWRAPSTGSSLEDGFYGGVSLPWLLCSLASAACIAALLGQTFPFLNRSSLSALYAARLTRTYVGASNPDRRKTDQGDVTELLPGDVIPLSEYRPHLEGGPLHLINTTLNETVDARSQVEQRDRHGMNLAIGPAGVSLAARHHGLWSAKVQGWPVPGSGLEPLVNPPTFSAFRPAADGLQSPESLHLGQWMAVSGAAISTGLGSRTSVGLSLLLGLLNVRLGRWWDSGASVVTPGDTGPSFEAAVGSRFAWLFPVQAHLFDELLARFHGPARRFWYLTDGGHFENTGAYELIRRHLPVIVVCDNGADPRGEFADIGNLVRLARTDFGAEVKFLGDGELSILGELVQDKGIGTLGDLGFTSLSQERPKTNAFAALATIAYGDSPESLLVLLRPRMTAELPVDVLAYERQSRGFPQQSTADQFFDEAQWESYRVLGYEMGKRVFGTPKILSEPWRVEVLSKLREARKRSSS